MPSLRLRCRALTAFAAACSTLAAQDGEPPLIVTATRGEQVLLEVPLSVASVGEEELRRRGDGSIASLFADIPGVDIVDVSVAGSGRLSIRGEAGSRCLVLIDGEPVSENKSMDGAPLLIDPATIARVEVVKGPTSVLYGSEAIGGVVNFITHEPAREPGIAGSADVSYHSATAGGGFNLRLSRSGESWYQSVGGSAARHGNRKVGDDGGRVHESGYEQWSANGRVGWRSDDSDIALVADWFEGSFEVSDYADDEIDIGLDLPTWSRGKVSLRGRWERLAPALARVKASFYAQRSEKVFDNDMVIIPMAMSIDIHTENDQPSVGGNVQADIVLGASHLLICGVELRRDLLEAVSHKRTENFFGTVVKRSRIEAHLDTAAAYAQDEWSIGERLVLTLGARVSLARSAVDSSDDPQVPIADGGDVHAVGSLAAVYRLSDDASLRGSVAQGYAYPTLDKLYIGTSHGSSSHVYPNPDLDPEQSLSIEAGLRLDDGRTVLDLAAFHSRASDYVSTVLLSGGPDRIFVNADRAVTSGAELSVRHTIAGAWTPHLSATAITRREEIEGVSSDAVGLPPVNGKAGLRWRGGAGGVLLDADLFLRGAAAAEEDSGGERLRYDGWVTANLDLGASWRADGCRWWTGLRLLNLADELYTPATQVLPAAGRAFVLSLGAAW